MELTIDSKEKINQLWSKRRAFVESAEEVTKSVINSLTLEQRKAIHGQWFNDYYINSVNSTNSVFVSRTGSKISRIWEFSPETQYDFLGWLQKM